jgi:dynein heavy chain
VEKGLNDFLDTKKLAFPRFFFLSNDELLEILSEAKDPLKVQPFMKKCFEAVKEVEFTKAITMKAMVSVEGEVVPLSKEIDPAETGAVEMWMLEFEDVMKESMREVTAKSIAEYATVSREEWILNWPGQVVIAGSQVYWTKEVTDAIVADGPKGLAAYGEKSNANLTNIVNMVRGELSKLERATMSALVTIDVHARDVVVQMAEDGVSDARDFKWLAQLRYFWEDETLRVRMINAEAQYGFEYLGNSSRLVITPLTDRCYRTLMGAIHLNLGGAPAGPAGTGKTETTKDLSKAIAIQCVVFNCSDGLDYKAMGKFFKGLAASGAWACFDEFNRIELEVLSVVAQQVLCIQRAVAAKVKTFEFEGVELRIIPTANVFITMNPGYAGRSELPDNLKALFRDVAMMVPDYAMIAEIILYSFGYLEARDMARKLVQTYRLCSEQLSSQDHYDYGMRAVISVLRAAGNLKRKFTEEREDVLMLRAITDVNLPKFLDQDVPLFRGILSDLFPGVDLPEIDYDNLLAAMRNNTKKANLQPLPSFEEKIIQLYEMIIVRHGLMIVGESFGMKSSCISVLAGALGELNEKGQNGEQKVKYYCINPKSITMGQLYGAEDPVSKEWADGILAVTFRNAARDTSPDRKWVVFDGPVDAIWIENMNTVLDDNKKLCLNSGEIIAMQGLMNMIFEVADLAVASPATVSRCGMVYVQPSLLGWRPVFLSWLDTLPPTLNEPQKEQITGMFDWLVPPCLRIATKMCKQPQPMQEINLAQSLMRLYESLLDEFRDEEKVAEMNKLLQAVWLDSLFLFALVWSIGASVDQEGRVKFDAMLRQLLAGDVPEELKIWMTAEPRKVTKLIPDANGATVYDFVFDKATGQWAKWTATQEDAPIAEEATYTSIIVPTVDTIRYTYLIDTFVLHQKNFLFVGPTGTGKTAYIKQHVANGIDPEKYSYLFMNFSAQTSANMTQVRPTHWSPYDRVGVVNADP